MAKILIIDDRPVNRQFLTTLLGYQHHQLSEASDGAEGLRIAREQRPDLIISDVLMPTMDGYEFVRRLRQEAEIDKTPVIFSTAHYLSRESQALAKKCGITQIIYKPCEPQVVLDIVAAALVGTVEAPPPALPVEEFDREHQQLLTNKVAEKTEQLRDTHGKLTALIELSTELASERDPAELLDRYCSVAREVIGARWTLIVLLDRGRAAVQHLGVVGLELEDTPALRSGLLETGIFKTVISEARTICLSDVTSTPEAMQLPKILPRAMSLLVAPLSLRERTHGWLCLADKMGLDAFSEQDEQLAMALAAKMAVAYDNACMYSDSLSYAKQLETEMSARAKVEQQLNENRARLAGIIASAMDSIITVDSDQRIVMFNEAAERMFRCAAGEVIGHSLDQLIPPQFRSTHSKDIRNFGETVVTGRAMAAARPVSGLRADGEEFPAEASISQIEIEGQRLYTVIMRDITERKQAEERLEEQATLLHLVHTAIMVRDPNNMITFWSRGAERLYGWSAEEALGKVTHEFLQTRFPRSLVEINTELIERGYWEGELIHTCKDGTEITVDSRWTSRRDPDDNVMAILEVNNDITERKQAEEKLRESEEQLRLFNRATNDMFWNWDLVTGQVARSTNFERVFGYVAQEIIPVIGWWEDRLHPEDRDRVLNAFQTAIERGDQACAYEYRFRRLDGTYAAISDRAYLVRDASGKVVRAMGAMTDITERKQAEEKLRESESRYRSLFDNMFNGFAFCRMIFDGDKPVDLVYLAVNRAFETITGLKDVVGKRVSEVIPGIMQTDFELFEHYGRVARTGVPERFEFWIEALQNWYWISVYSPLEDHIGVIFDVITERKQAEIRIQHLNRVYAVLSDINQMIVRTREPQKIFENACRIAVEKGRFRMAWLGLLDDDKRRVRPQAWAGAEDGYLNAIDIDLLNQTVSQGPAATAVREGRFVISNDLENDQRMTPWRDEMLKRGYRSSAAFPLRREGETVGSFNLYAAEPGFFDDEEVRLLNELSMDISFALEVDRRETQRQQAEASLRVKSQELASMTQQLWQSSKLATMGELAASIAHELNNPLTTITLTLDLIMMQLEGDESKMAALEKVRGEADRMGKLVSNLLTFSRRSHAQFSTVDLREEIRNTIEFIHYYLRDHRVKVDLDFTPDLAPVHADRQQMRQLFLNLVTNSCDAMPDGGVLVARARTEPSENDSSCVVVELTDTGAGISAADLQNVWDPFFTTKPEGKGTGLGLAICRRIVEEHRGTMAIESELGRGTTVRMTLPVSSGWKE